VIFYGGGFSDSVLPIKIHESIVFGPTNSDDASIPSELPVLSINILLLVASTCKITMFTLWQ
jgi:hypothetical protein